MVFYKAYNTYNSVVKNYEEEVFEPLKDFSDIKKIKNIQDVIQKSELNLYKDAPDLLLDKAQHEKCFKIDYRGKMNIQQYCAASTTEGPVLIIAGAGSGKTSCLVHRVAYMIESGINPYNILILTFTNKAAKEMLRRAHDLFLQTQEEKKSLHPEFELIAPDMNIDGGTFHSFAVKILKRYAKHINLNPSFKIIDTGDSEDIVGSIYKEMDIEHVKGIRKAKLFALISKTKNTNKSMSEIVHADTNDPNYRNHIDELEELAKKYIEYKHKNNVCDYDDLLIVLRDKLRDYKEMRESVQERYKYILVDEMQDTNVVQKEIVDLIASKYRNVMAVGDDSQSVYAFRGAEVENIFLFTQTYPEAKIIKIEQNYRSKQDILNITNAIMAGANIGYKKKLFSTNVKEGIPVIKTMSSKKQEAQFIVQEIKKLKISGQKNNDIAILYKASFHNSELQAELVKNRIPFVVYGGMKFLEKKHIKDIMAFLNVAYEPRDTVSMSRCMRLVEGLGNATISKIISAANGNRDKLNISMYNQKSFYSTLDTMLGIIESLTREDMSVHNKLKLLAQYYDRFLEIDEEDEFKLGTKRKDLQIMSDLALDYAYDVDCFLDDLMLEPPTMTDTTQGMIKKDKDKDIDSVILSTVHSAKGLEWNSVFVMHMVENGFPSQRAKSSFSELEEERRLFYVACTRARNNLFLTAPSSNTSRFLRELLKGSNIRLL